MNVAVLGRGRVGRGLASALAPKGGPVAVRCVSGHAPPARTVRWADAVVLAVPDGAIAAVAAAVADVLRPGTAVLHCAGARGPDELSVLRDRRMHVGVMHPLVSFADAHHAPALAGTTFVVSGDRSAVKAARAIGRAVGARVVVADVHGPAYHAAAALVANGAAALADAATRVLIRVGLRPREAERAVGALLRTVADNVEHLGMPRALTGPVARGDAATVSAHRHALAAVDRRAKDAYDAVGSAIIESAIGAGLPAAHARRVRQAFGAVSAKAGPPHPREGGAPRPPRR